MDYVKSSISQQEVTVTLISLIIVLIIAGVCLWAVNSFIPMDPKIKQLLNVLVIIVLAIVVIVFLLNFAGINTGSHLRLN